jgi:uncharacterized membrane protein (DUF106 family)
MNLFSPFTSITLISLGLSFLIAFIYRVLTKPGQMKKVKEDMKFYKEKMGQAQKSGDRAKANEYASEMLKASQAQFRIGMKPMMATMLIFFLLLGWLNSAYGGVSIDFSANQTAVFSYGGTAHKVAYYKVEGDPKVTMKAGIDFNDDNSFADNEIFSQGAVFQYGGAYWRVGPKMEGFALLGGSQPKADTVSFDMLVARAPFTIPFIGDYISWFWWYVFLSIPGTMVFRKLLGVE